MTDTLTKLPAALAKFQSQHHAAGRDGKGNYGTYTTLAGALAAIQPACALGLSHTQLLVTDEHGLKVRTILMHESGEQLISDAPVLHEGGRGSQMQSMGSAITYARRYGLLGVYGIAGDDDDGESAAPTPKPQPKTVKTSPTPAQQKPASAKAETPPPADAPAPLSASDKAEITEVLKHLMKVDRASFDSFCSQYRAQFNLADNAKITEHMQEAQHGVTAQQILATLTPT